MPRGDGTGPAGKGPRTGAQRGKCVGARSKRRVAGGKGRGLGRGRGRKSN
jgi:hypothetical protein